jgi:hypothetical protein
MPRTAITANVSGCDRYAQTAGKKKPAEAGFS